MSDEGAAQWRARAYLRAREPQQRHGAVRRLAVGSRCAKVLLLFFLCVFVCCDDAIQSANYRVRAGVGQPARIARWCGRPNSIVRGLKKAIAP